MLRNCGVRYDDFLGGDCLRFAEDRVATWARLPAGHIGCLVTGFFFTILPDMKETGHPTINITDPIEENTKPWAGPMEARASSTVLQTALVLERDNAGELWRLPLKPDVLRKCNRTKARSNIGEQKCP